MDPNQPEAVPIGMVPSPAEQQRPAAHSGAAKAPTGAKQQPNHSTMGDMKKILTWQDFHGKDLTTVVEYEPSEGASTEDEEEYEQSKCCTIS